MALLSNYGGRETMPTYGKGNRVRSGLLRSMAGGGASMRDRGLAARQYYDEAATGAGTLARSQPGFLNAPSGVLADASNSISRETGGLRSRLREIMREDRLERESAADRAQRAQEAENQRVRDLATLALQTNRQEFDETQAQVDNEFKNRQIGLQGRQLELTGRRDENTAVDEEARRLAAERFHFDDMANKQNEAIGDMYRYYTPGSIEKFKQSGNHGDLVQNALPARPNYDVNSLLRYHSGLMQEYNNAAEGDKQGIMDEAKTVREQIRGGLIGGGNQQGPIGSAISSAMSGIIGGLTNRNAAQPAQPAQPPAISTPNPNSALGQAMARARQRGLDTNTGMPVQTQPATQPNPAMTTPAQPAQSYGGQKLNPTQLQQLTGVLRGRGLTDQEINDYLTTKGLK